MRNILGFAVLAAVALVGCGGGDTATGDATRGATLFNSLTLGTTTKAQGCAACHANGATTGPALTGFGAEAKAEFAAAGKSSAFQFAKDAIIKPNEEIATGFMAGSMPTNYSTVLTETDQNDLAAYLLTL